MRPAILQTREYGRINLRVHQSEGSLYVECRETNTFLRHLSSGELSDELPSSTWVRGIVTPGQGAMFELFDQFGSIGEISALTGRDLSDRLLDYMIWQV